MALNNNNKSIILNKSNKNIRVDQLPTNIIYIDEPILPTTRVIDELNNFEECIMPFGKYRGTSMKQMYLEDYKYCKWIADNIQEPRGKLIDFIALVNKYRTN